MCESCKKPQPNRDHHLTFAAAGHTIYGSARAINYVADLIDQQERENRLLRRRLAEAQEDLADYQRRTGVDA